MKDFEKVCKACIFKHIATYYKIIIKESLNAFAIIVTSMINPRLETTPIYLQKGNGQVPNRVPMRICGCSTLVHTGDTWPSLSMSNHDVIIDV